MTDENKKTILLVEDEAIISIVVSKALKRFGYNVLNASSGERSVELTFSDEKIDLILMDINLGDGIDGTEAARRILAGKNIPIVFHTSHSEREMVDKVRNITRYGYVVKSSGDFVLQSSMEMAFDLFNSHEKERKESLRSQTILRTIPDMMFVVDDKGFFKDFSGSSDSDSLAIPSEEIIGNNISILFSPDEVEKLLALFRMCLETGEVQNYVYTMYVHEEQRVFDLRIARLDDAEILAIVRDITERKRAELEIKSKTEELEAANEELSAAMEEMEASNEELIAANEDLLAKDKALLREKNFIEALLESVPGYLYVYDDQGNLIRWNKKHETMTGYSAEELSHMNMSDWFEGEDAQRVAAAVDEVFRTGYGEVEANLKIKGGGKLLIRSNGVKLTIDDKIYFTGVGLDISKQKESENALRRSEELYKKAQKMGHVGNWEYNLQTTNFWGSDEAKHIYGFDPEQKDFSTEEVEKCIPERERVHQALIDLIESDKEYNLEFEIYPKDGSKPKTIWSIAELQRDENGTPLIVTGVIQDITGRRMAEDALKSSELSLNLLMQSLPVPVFYKDNQGRYTGFNQAFEAFFGAKKEDITGKSVFDINPPELAAIYHKQDLVLFEKATIQVYESQVKNARGQLRDVIFHKGSIRDLSGNITGLIGVVLDITERKQAERDLKSAEETYRNIFLNSQIGLFRSEVETGLMLDVNETLARFAGYDKRASLLSDNYNVTEHYVEKDERNRMISILKENGEVHNFEALFRRKDKSVIWMRFSAKHIKDKGWLEGVAEDITEWKQAEEALKKSEYHYRLLAENVIDVIWTCDLNLNMIYTSPSVFLQQGYTPDEISQIGPEKRFPEHSLGILMTRFAEEMERENDPSSDKNRSIRIEVEAFKKDGSLYWAEFLLSFTRDENGNPTGFHGTTRDITLQKQSEFRIKSLLLEKEILLTETHHRINNNMNTIYGLLTLQSGELEDKGCSRILDDSAHRIKSMMILYDKLYRSDNFNEMSIKHFLEPLITEVIGLFSLNASVKADVDIEDFILSSKVLSPVGIIINEFITNSIKYAFNNKEIGIIHVSAKREDSRVTVIYGDNGAGLPDSVTFENSTGFGMQLAVMLTEQIGGSLRIERGEGTRFVLEFDAV
jgi:PAS domain S-box-containing protein